MRKEELQELIRQPEGLKLDFKRELHKIYQYDLDYRKQQKDELIRDILSLTNGNFGTANQVGYLIIGVGDELKPDGTRDLFNIERTLNPKQILQRVNSACYPPIIDIHCEIIEFYGKNIFVISIPPSPYLHTTIRELITPKIYPAGTTFIRRNEEIYPATLEECEVISKDKECAYSYLIRPQIYENMPNSNVTNFLGREKEIETLYQLFEQHEIVGIVGMAGVGKTELANQFGRQFLKSLNDSHGGVCWINAKNGDIEIQIISFARSVLGLKPPKDLKLAGQVEYCWQNWQQGSVLLVFDDVTDYRLQVKPYLPPKSLYFKVILTTREVLRTSFAQLRLDELKLEAALRLLEILMDDVERFQQELDIAEKICQWLGYLPLGLELVGSYLWKHKNLSLKRMLSLLEEKSLEHVALQKPDQVMNAELGIAAAFDLSWEKLDNSAQELSCLLSLFAVSDIHWSLVELAYSSLLFNTVEEHNYEIIEDARVDLVNCHILLSSDKYTYRLHPLTQKNLRTKLEHLENSKELKQAFISAILTVAQQIPQTATRQQIQAIMPGIIHIQEIVEYKSLRDYLTEDNLLLPFIALGKFYTSQCLYEEARYWYEYCLKFNQTIYGSHHPNIAASLNNLATLYCEQNHFFEAEPLLIEALDIQKQLLGENDIEIASSLNNLANIYCDQSRYQEAEPLFLKALAILQVNWGDNHPEVARIENNLASLYFVQGSYIKAESLFIKSLETRKRIFGEAHLDLAISFNDLGMFYKSQRRYSESEPLLLKALEIRQLLLPANHRYLAQSLNNLAELYREQLRFDEADILYLQALEIYEKWHIGEEHLEMAIIWNNIALLYQQQQKSSKYDEAEMLYLRSLKIKERYLGEIHPEVAIGLHNLGILYHEQCRYKKAEEFLLKALEMKNKIFGDEHPNILMNLNELANLYFSQKLYKKAEKLLLDILEIKRNSLLENDVDMGTYLHKLATAYLFQSRYSEAETLLNQALKLKKSLLGDNHPDVFDSLHTLAELYYSQKQYRKAEPLYIKVLGHRKLLLGENHIDVVTSLNDLGMLYAVQERYAEAEPYLVEALQKKEHLLSVDHPDVRESLSQLGLVYFYQERYTQAEKIFLKAVKIYQGLVGLNHPDTVRCLKCLELVRLGKKISKSKKEGKKGFSNKTSKGFGK